MLRYVCLVEPLSILYYGRRDRDELNPGRAMAYSPTVFYLSECKIKNVKMWLHLWPLFVVVAAAVFVVGVAWKCNFQF